MVRRKYDIPVIIAIVLALIGIASFRSEFRLRSEMPTEFFDSKRVPREKRASEEKIAKAYWNCAVQQVQWKYGYASRLPNEPPPEFAVSTSEIGPIGSDETVRRRYWQQLRATWPVSAAWQTDWEWNFVAFRQSLRTSSDWWKNLVRSIARD